MKRSALICLLLMSVSMASCASAPAAVPSEPGHDWEVTLEGVANGVVALRVDVPRWFDTESSGSYLGTGFVVDVEQGLILTNRHLVQPGPVVAEAVFLNHEEVDLQAVYRDPVHDFGVFRFDPSEIRYMDVTELTLAPEAARVGMDIRVVGNDAGEKLSILSGTLARLDRPAPDYGEDTYNDFNTFYYQAASDTSGGSSGSPVVATDGRVVALNAGGSWRSSSSYYLPLDRVVRALDLIRQGRPVTRGTLGTIFVHTPFDELGRLGLSAETEAEVRGDRPTEVGMLVVDQVVPGGPADDLLEPGDVLLAVNGALTTRFIPLEEVVDDSVGASIELQVERGGERHTLTMTVGDLHAVTPSEYVEVGGAILHALSFQQARNNNIRPEGVYVTSPGYMLSAARVPGGALIRTINGQPVTTLDGLWETLTSIADGERVAIRYAEVHTPRFEQIGVARMDRRWFPMRFCRRDDNTGRWPCIDAEPPPENGEVDGGSTTFATTGPGPAPALAASLVMVDYAIPYRVEGVWGSQFTGTGLVVDAERGLVVVDRDTVPVGLGDAELTFGGSLRIPGKVEFIHPVHNFALLSYDPALVEGTPIRSADLRAEGVTPGDPVWLVGLDPEYQLVARSTRVARQVPLLLPYPSRRPQFRDVNVEVIETDDVVDTLGGVLADDQGRVLALWTSFHISDSDEYLDLDLSNGLFRGLPIELIELATEPLRRGEPVGFRELGVELGTVNLADARDLGLSDARADALESHDPERRQALTVTRVYSGFPASELLRGGDVILTVQGAPVTRFIEVERASQEGSVRLEILRDGEELAVEAETVALGGFGIDRVVGWAGLLLHPPHLEVAAQRGLEPEGIYIAWLSYGSPASSAGIRPTHRIVEVDGRPTPDLDAFLAAVGGRSNRDSVRLRTLDLENRPHMQTLRLDLDYWPTFELELGNDGWTRRDL